MVCSKPFSIACVLGPKHIGQCTIFHENISKILFGGLSTGKYYETDRWTDKFKSNEKVILSVYLQPFRVLHTFVDSIRKLRRV